MDSWPKDEVHRPFPLGGSFYPSCLPDCQGNRLENQSRAFRPSIRGLRRWWANMWVTFMISSWLVFNQKKLWIIGLGGRRSRLMVCLFIYFILKFKSPNPFCPNPLRPTMAGGPLIHGHHLILKVYHRLNNRLAHLMRPSTQSSPKACHRVNNDLAHLKCQSAQSSHESLSTVFRTLESVFLSVSTTSAESSTPLGQRTYPLTPMTPACLSSGP